MWPTLEIYCSTTGARRLRNAVSETDLHDAEPVADGVVPAESKNLPDAPDMEDEDEEWGADDPAAMTANDRLSKLRMASLVKQYLQAQNLEVLVENGLEDAVMRFVDKDDKDAIKE